MIDLKGEEKIIYEVAKKRLVLKGAGVSDAKAIVILCREQDEYRKRLESLASENADLKEELQHVREWANGEKEKETSIKIQGPGKIDYIDIKFQEDEG